MAACPLCRADTPPRSRFCSSCGAPLEPAGPAAGAPARRQVTLLFTDVAGSTELGEARDPEAVRAVMDRMFALAHTVIERHGGLVEKFVGDAVMAAFGLP